MYWYLWSTFDDANVKKILRIYTIIHKKSYYFIVFFNELGFFYTF